MEIIIFHKTDTWCQKVVDHCCTKLFLWVTDNMAHGSMMMDPICLVENYKSQLTVNPQALRILDNISQPVVVVAIAGLYRTGKSYLMNRLAGQNHGECYPRTGAIWWEAVITQADLIFFAVILRKNLAPPTEENF